MPAGYYRDVPAASPTDPIQAGMGLCRRSMLLSLRPTAAQYQRR